jgi:hypothetical protein
VSAQDLIFAVSVDPQNQRALRIKRRLALQFQVFEKGLYFFLVGKESIANRLLEQRGKGRLVIFPIRVVPKMRTRSASFLPSISLRLTSGAASTVSPKSPRCR